MKLLISIAVLVFIIHLQPGKTLSQTEGFMGTVGAGVSFPIKDLSQNYKTGYELGGKAGYIFNSNIASGLAIDFESFGYKHDSLVLTGGSAKYLSIKSFVMLGNLNVREKLNLYFLIGAGLFLDKRSQATTLNGAIDASDFKSHFGMDFGFGISYKISKALSGFIEPRYSGTFEDMPSLFISVKVGVMFVM